MTARYLVTLLAVCCAVSAEAQLNLLTLREAETLVELIPDVAASLKQGGCPIMSPGYDREAKFDFWVRTSCGPDSGTLIGSYTVNTKTGEVETWGDDPESVADTQGQVLAAQLVKEARGRALSADEAQCLALSAARSLPGWSAPAGAISVKRLGEPGSSTAKANAREGVIHFSAKRVSQSGATESGRSLTVYPNEARVRDEEIGMDVMSAAVGDLADKLTQLRQPVWLTDLDAGSVAVAVPQVAGNLQKGCFMDVGGPFYSQEVSVGVWCKNALIRDSLVLVNLGTGAVTSPDKRRSFDSPKTKRVAGAFLSAVQRRRTQLQKIVETTCHLP